MERDMGPFLILSYIFAVLIIGLVLYMLYCWKKDQRLQDEKDDHDAAAFDLDLLDKPKDRDSGFAQ